jgi:low affinity Fe/Cu permease
MPSEACYVLEIENAILIALSYGILSWYLEDVMGHGFLYFYLFAGLSLCYCWITAGFGLLLLDAKTHAQIVLLDAGDAGADGAQLPPMNSVPRLARIISSSASTCASCIFLVFLTVACEYFTDTDSLVAGSLPSIGLKQTTSEAKLTTQIAVSTALAVFLMILIMLLSNNKQLASIHVRLEHESRRSGLLRPEQTYAQDGLQQLVLFIRCLFIGYLTVCESTGAFDPLLPRSMPTALLNRAPFLKHYVFGLRNGTTFIFIVWCFALDTARTFLPQSLWFLIIIDVLDGVQVFGNILTIEVLFWIEDQTLTNFACLILCICDAAIVAVICLLRIYQKIKSTGSRDKTTEVKYTPYVLETQPAPEQSKGAGLYNTEDFYFPPSDIKLHQLNLQVFGKKSN